MAKTLYNLKVDEISLIFLPNSPAVPGARVLTLKSKENTAMTDETLRKQIEELTQLVGECLVRDRALIERTARMIAEIADELSNKAIEKLKKKLHDGEIVIEDQKTIRYMGGTIYAPKKVNAQADHLAKLKKWNPKAYQKALEGFWRSVNAEAVKDADQSMADADNNEYFSRRYSR